MLSSEAAYQQIIALQQQISQYDYNYYTDFQTSGSVIITNANKEYCENNKVFKMELI